MNADTHQAVTSILKNGYYRKGTTLGEGGWPSLRRAGIDEWKVYQLYGEQRNDAIDQVTAQDDETAFKAFASLYHLDMIPGYIIVEKIVTFRTVREDETSEVLP